MAHRTHASIVGPPRFLPSAAGLRFAKEIEVLGGIRKQPARPFVAVVGGAKLADKLEVLKVLATKVDTLVVGVGWRTRSWPPADRRWATRCWTSRTWPTAGPCWTRASRSCCRPTPVPWSPAAPSGRPPGRRPRGSVKVIEGDLPDGWTGLDIGPDSAAAFAEVAPAPAPCCGTAPWAPLRTPASPRAPALWPRRWPTAPASRSSEEGTAPARSEELGLCDRVGYLSTGGGASLSFIEREGHLPGIDALRRAPNAPRDEHAGHVVHRAMSTRRPLVSGNWKMHHDHIEALHTVRDLGLRLKPDDVAHRRVGPPALHRPAHRADAGGEGPHPGRAGRAALLGRGRRARTGEISPRFLARLGTAYVIVGHSERRTLFGMDDATVASTLRAVLRNGMTPVLCIGESEEQRDARQTEAILEEQVLAVLPGLAPEVVGGLVLAYEPLWAIGTGKAATAVDAEDACVFIRSLVAKAAGDEAAAAVRIQYGGSVNAENAADLMAEPDVDGLLVGGASLEAAAFTDIIRATAACYRS